MGQYFMIQWPCVLWYILVFGMSAKLATMPASYYSEVPFPIIVARGMFAMMAVLGLTGVLLVLGSMRTLHSAAFKQGCRQANCSESQQIDWTDWTAQAKAIGNIFDCNVKAFLLYIVKGMFWYAVVGKPLGIFDRHVEHTTFAYWIVLSTSMGFFDLSWNFVMAMCEALRKEAVQKVLSMVQTGPPGSGNKTPDDFWWDVIESHKKMDEELKMLWKQAEWIFLPFLAGLVTLVFACIYFGLYLVSVYSKDPSHTIHWSVSAMVGLVSIYAAFRASYMLIKVASITDMCLSTDVCNESIYSAAVQKCGNTSGMPSQGHRDFLAYLDRNPTGVVMGTRIDTSFVIKACTSLGTLGVTVVSYMMAVVGLSAQPDNAHATYNCNCSCPG